MATKQVVFVRGGKTAASRPWRFFHFHPTKDVNPGPVDLVYFDYRAGVRRTLRNWVPTRIKIDPTKFDDAVALSPVVRIRERDMSLGQKRPSVLALYEWIKRQKAGSILSLQFFGHGYSDGPIIWLDCYENSSEEDLSADRDPHDTEFRGRDFLGKNPLAGAEGKKFAAAFSRHPFIKLWGCNANPDLRVLARNYIEAPRGAGGDAERKAHLRSYHDAMKVSFQYQLADKLNLPSWVSPYGWGTNGFDTEDLPGGGKRKVKYTGAFPPDLKKEHWWRVSAFFREQPKYFRFYRDTLKSRIDATAFFQIDRFWIDNVRKLTK